LPFQKSFLQAWGTLLNQRFPYKSSAYKRTEIALNKTFKENKFKKITGSVF